MLLVGTRDGLYKVQGDGNGNGKEEAAPVFTHKRRIMSMATDAAGQTCYLGLYRGGVVRTTDGGRTWTDVGEGLSLKDVRTVAMHPHDPRIVYAGTEPAALFVSRDGGEHWEELDAIRTHPHAKDWTFPVPPGRGHVRTLAFDPRNADVMYLGIEVGSLLKSTDRGRTWEELEGCGHDIHKVVIHPDDPETVLVTTGMDTKPYHKTGRHGLFRSIDGGQTWAAANAGLGERTYCEDAISFDPLNPKRVYLATARGIPPHWASMTALTWGILTGGFVYFVSPSRLRRRTGAEVVINRSDDGGQTWQQVGKGLPAPLFDMVWTLDATSVADKTNLYMGTTGGEIYASHDAGENWSRMIKGLPSITHIEAFAS